MANIGEGILKTGGQTAAALGKLPNLGTIASPTIPVSNPVVGMPSLGGIIGNVSLPNDARIGVIPLIEREFLKLKSKILPPWIRVAFPVNNPAYPLGDTDLIAGNAEAKTRRDATKDSEASHLLGSNKFLDAQKSLSFARPNRYVVAIHLPDAVENAIGGATLPSILSTTCQNAQIPGRSFATYESRRDTLLLKYPYDPIYEDVTLTFRVGHDMLQRTIFEEWFSLVWDRKEGGTFAYYGEYAAKELKVIQLGQDMQPVKHYIMKNACPVNLGPIELGWDLNDAIETFTVTFTYRTWEVE